MDAEALFKNLYGRKIHLVGIKGTGMTGLAELLLFHKAVLTGSDGKARFYTDAILQALQIPVTEEFTSANVTPDIELVIHSTAYTRDTNPDLQQAAALGIPLLTYPEALGLYSAACESAGIAGVHGKTTTTALAGVIAKRLQLPAAVLAGSQVSGFDNRCTLCLGSRYFIAETCEYQSHFLHFHPAHIIITAVELDHPDYFKSVEDVYQAFTAYALHLPRGGTVIHNADDPGVREVVGRTRKLRPDLEYIPYGMEAEGAFRITELDSRPGELIFRLQGLALDFYLRVPGRHNVWNAAAAIALCYKLAEREHTTIAMHHLVAIQQAVSSFTGTRRRSEILGQAGGVLFMDDYAHHPTAVLKTLQGYKEFFPGRRLVVDFMSHTYSRTVSLLDEFGKCFAPAEEVILHKIYASARETNAAGITGKELYERVQNHHPHVRYFPEFEPAVEFLKTFLEPGDLFVTMGAGDNWEVGRAVFDSKRITGN